ncbi:MAG: hypothetical protein WKG00_25345 [Polyangiaceae bacterium]
MPQQSPASSYTGVPGQFQPRPLPPWVQPAPAAPPPGAYGYQPPVWQTPPWQPPPPPAPVADNARDDDDSDRGAVGGFAIVGARLSRLAVHDTDNDGTTWGGQIAWSYDGVMTSGLFTGRVGALVGIGGGGGGLEGMYGGDFSVGVRAPIARTHGPVARLGFGGRVRGNDHLLDWYIELPELQLGYQIASDNAVLDLVARGGVVLGGGWSPGEDAEREIGTSLAYGGSALLAMIPLSVSGTVLRILERKYASQTPVDLYGANLCIGYAFAVCGDLSYTRGDVLLPGGAIREAEALYGGMIIGIGIAGAAGTK